VVDLNALHRELHRALTRAGIGAHERGGTVARSLAALEVDDRATLATHLVHNFTDHQLLGLGRNGLRALRRAVCLDAAERKEHALERLDGALKTLPPITATLCDEMWVLSAGPLPGAVTRAVVDAPPGTVLIVVPRQAEKAALCDYYRQCFEELPEACARALAGGQVTFLPVDRIRAPVWSKLRSLAVRVLAPAWV
jgi:hypothetical protein